MSNLNWTTRWDWNDQFGTVGDWHLAVAEDELDNVGGLSADDPIGTAIILSLLTDARIPDHMLARYGLTKKDQREWHGNTFGVDADEAPLGSWLWVLRRSALSHETARLAEHFAALALQPLVRAKAVAGFNITSEVSKVEGRISLYIQVIGNQKTYTADLYALR